MLDFAVFPELFLRVKDLAQFAGFAKKATLD